MPSDSSSHSIEPSPAVDDVVSSSTSSPTPQKVSKVAAATSHTFSASNKAVRTDAEDAFVEAVPTAVASVMSPDYFLAHWQEILPRYIGHGRPAFDTMVHYTSYINQFFDWCAAIHRHPMEVTDYEMRGFLEWLYGQGYKDDTIAVKLVAIRRFFAAAERLHIIAENPCQDIYVPNATPDELIHFFTPDQLYEICAFYGENEDAFLRERNISIVYLMGVEGMRNVEIHRMNREDIDMDVNSIFVRGKGHDRRIFPCEETMAHLRAYLAASRRCSFRHRAATNSAAFPATASVSSWISLSSKRASKNLASAAMLFVTAPARISMPPRKTCASCRTRSATATRRRRPAMRMSRNA